jgi:bifunctional non-homologous end joining protein LigD
VTSFSRLQRRARERVSVFLYVFDILCHEGRDVRDLPLRERKALLRDAFEFGGRLRYLGLRDDKPAGEVVRERPS